MTNSQPQFRQPVEAVVAAGVAYPVTDAATTPGGAPSIALTTIVSPCLDAAEVANSCCTCTRRWRRRTPDNLIVDGKVGIGTTSPAKRLTISDGTAASFVSTVLGIYNPYTGNAAVRNWALQTDCYAYGDFGILTSAAQGGDPTAASALKRLYIASSGEVSIGFASPNLPRAKLTIDGGLHVGGETDPGDNNVIVDGNVGIGVTTFGASANKVLSIGTGTAPSAHVDDSVQFFSVDVNGAGTASLGLFTEEAVTTPIAITPNRYLNININGTVYKLCLST